MKDNDEYREEGSYEAQDRARQISKAVIRGFKIFCTVEWERRPNGFLPADSIYTNTDIAVKDPMTLIRYYETKLKIIKKDD